MSSKPSFSFGDGTIRFDLQLVADLVEANSRVLDIGCGDGALLAHLVTDKNVDGRGLELEMSRVSQAVAQGLSVIQGNLETDLNDYPDGAFDYVILSQTLPATHAPKDVLDQMLRIGKRAIVSFPNFGHWACRLSVLLSGRMPRTKSLPRLWYDTPNIHLCTVLDFVDLAKELGLTIEAGFALDERGKTLPFGATGGLSNLLSNQVVFMLSRS